MFAVYEIHTGEVVATFADYRHAIRRAEMLTEENASEGYEFSVRQIKKRGKL